MSSRILITAGLTGAALLAATAYAAQANAGTTGPAVVHAGAHAAASGPAKNPCYDTNADDSHTGVLSTVTDDPAGYTSIGAANFTVHKRCVISTVNATGVYAAGSGPADSETVTFYRNKAGLPGAVVNTQTVTANVPTGVWTLPIKRVVLTKGKYYVSVQASMDYNQVGGWYWEITPDVVGTVDVWQNNGGAFNNCPTWQPLTTCFGLNDDFMLTLSK